MSSMDIGSPPHYCNDGQDSHVHVDTMDSCSPRKPEDIRVNIASLSLLSVSFKPALPWAPHCKIRMRFSLGNEHRGPRHRTLRSSSARARLVTLILCVRALFDHVMTSPLSLSLRLACLAFNSSSSTLVATRSTLVP